MAQFLERLKRIAADPRAANVIAIAAHMMEYTPKLAAFRTAPTSTQLGDRDGRHREQQPIDRDLQLHKRVAVPGSIMLAPPGSWPTAIHISKSFKGGARRANPRGLVFYIRQLPLLRCRRSIAAGFDGSIWEIHHPECLIPS